MAVPTKEELTSSSSSTHRWSYDIFLSFQGEDTRYGFTGHLYNALHDSGLITFFDNNLERGEMISKEFLKTIEMSMISIVVLSENYASSPWCLDELVKILECKNARRIRKVYPIFYKVTPSEVRNNDRKDGKYGIALDNHEKKFEDDMEKVKRWREALTEVANLSGLEYKNGEIVEQESEELENRSRIWCYEDAYKLLIENMGSKKIRGIMWHSPKPRTVNLQADTFKNMRNLKFLLVENIRISKGLKYFPNELRLLQWPEYDFLLPLKFYPHNLVVLNMRNSQIRLEKLLKQDRKFEKLKNINLIGCKCTTQLPSLLCAPNLKNLDMSGCENLIEVDESIGYLDKLEMWNLDYCRNLEILPSLPKLKSLKSFGLRHCNRLEKFPAICAPNLGLLDIYFCENLIEVHKSVGYLDKLETWNLDNCRNLEILPSLPMLKSLKRFGLCHCERLEKFPAIHAPNLVSLDISFCENLIEVHKSVGDLHQLEMWNLNSCRKLEILPNLLLLKSLKRIDLCHCERLEKFPAICSPNLEFLDISFCENLIEVPESVGYLDKLKDWDLTYCRNLENLPSLPMLKSLVRFDLCHCERLEKFPAICAPNLVSLDISFCENLIEVHKSVGDLHKLRDWNLESCRKLEILPSRLLLRSLNYLNLNHCERLEKFPDIHPEVKCLPYLKLTNSGIREWPSSLMHLTKELRYLALSNPKNLGNFLHSSNKLQLLEEIDIPTANSFDGFSGYGFLSLTRLDLNYCDGDITELDFQYFPLLRYLHIYDCNIISIPQSISGLARLETIRIEYCKQLREIPTLPQSVRNVEVNKCPSLDLQSSSRLLIRFGEILGILPNRAHEGARSHISMDPFHDSESESEYEIQCFLQLPAIEIQKCLKFNHQSFGNSVSFWVGEIFSKLAVCIAFRQCQVFDVLIFINGCELRPNFNIDKGVSEELWLFSVSRGQLNKRKLSEQNHIEVKVLCRTPFKVPPDIIKWIGVNVECTCYPQNSNVTCLPLPCAMNGCGSSSIPNDTELPPFLPVSSTSSASDSDHRVFNNGRNYILAGTGLQKRRRICL
ncbi:TMV resistance protein N-like isoform X2 [Castanea sativa]|uniref:TMV resistance protein N-like isoform X2 n=1 Tax=Castanea sativa TaxID=21020 RepID=UPI003F64A812